MPGVSRISSLWRNLTQRRRVERDLDDEVRAAFDLRVREARALRTLLFGVRPLDLLSFGGAVVLFAAIGMLACYLPTRRAVRTDAMDALRYE